MNRLLLHTAVVQGWITDKASPAVYILSTNNQNISRKGFQSKYVLKAE